MTRLFDAKHIKPDEKPDNSKPVLRNVVNREAVAAANQAMRNVGMEPDLIAGGVKEVDRGVVPVKYTNEIIGKWQIDHGARGDDYLLQLIPRKPIGADPRDVIQAIIQVIAGIIPSDIQVYINPPNQGLEIDFYTVRLEGVLTKPGSESIVSKQLVSELGSINAWA